MKNYKWLYSYEIAKFDTPDGDIHPGEFARVSDGADELLGTYIVSDTTDAFKRVKELDTTGMTEVHIDGTKAFDVFQDPDTGEEKTFPCDIKTYKNLAKPGAGPRIKIKD